MKKPIVCLIAILALASSLYAQGTNSLPYQAVARNSDGTPIPNKEMWVRLSIRNLTSGGAVLYKEKYNVTTNKIGSFNVNVGEGTAVSGTYSTIDWANGAKYLQVEIDTTDGDSTYIDMGTTKLLSVPFALYAASSGNVANNGETFGITIDGSGGVISTGSMGYTVIPYSGHITHWYVVADASCSCVIDLKRAGASIIGAGNKPTLSSAQRSDAVPASWTSTSITASDELEFSVVSATGCKRVNLIYHTSIP